MYRFCGCGMTYPRCKEDCYWYEEWQDMGAHIPYCRCKRAVSIEPEDCENCEQYHSKYKPTNADRIRQKSDEELADFIGGIFTIERDMWGDCDPRIVVTQEPRVEVRNKEDILDWLKQEVKESEN